uniref:uncharacterized protein LOC122601328 n=1 Tax=Erigeron canadensis TaxID=72917 RepID=UPI001CB920C2|nr:uncharacterized protein LOC122601328 [Erigeron canadensis]
MADSSSSVLRGAGRNKRPWTTHEDAKLIDALMDLHTSGKYSGADNGFKPGYHKAVEQLLEVSLPDSGLKADPHIKSRMKTLKANFSVVHDMLVGTNTSGFGWNSETCCIDAEDQVWNEYIKSHKTAASFRGKPLPFYEKLCTIFGKDRATGSQAVDLGDEDTLEDSPVTPVTSPPITTPLDVDTDAPTSNGPPSSAINKRKRSKSADGFNDTFHGCSIDLTKSIESSINSLDDKIVESANQGSNIGGGILDQVIVEIQNLPNITWNERVKGMHIIGQNQSMAKIFLQLPEEGRVCYIQMLRDGPLD